MEPQSEPRATTQPDPLFASIINSPVYDINRTEPTNSVQMSPLPSAFSTTTVTTSISLGDGEGTFEVKEIKATPLPSATFSIPAPGSKLDSKNLGSLLRLFRSSFFDSWMAVSYLHKYPHPGVHDYLCNELYALPDEEIEFYLPQICNLMVFQPIDTKGIQRFLLDKCAKSIHFALKIAWIMQAYVEDDNPAVRDKCMRIREDCEIAAVNCRRVERGVTSGGVIPNGGSLPSLAPDADPNATDLKIFDDIQLQSLSKQDRADYFDRIIKFIDSLGDISDRLRKVYIPLRQKKLEEEIQALNADLSEGLYLPLWTSNHPHYCIARIPPSGCHVLNSRDRVPFLMVLEVLESQNQKKCSDNEIPTGISKIAIGNNPLAGIDEAIKHDLDRLMKRVEEYEQKVQPQREATDMAQKEIENLQKKNAESSGMFGLGKPKMNPIEAAAMAGHNSPAPPTSAAPKDPANPKSYEVHTIANVPFLETWEQQKEALRAKSSFGHLPGWTAYSVIVKYGDELRQEHLATQLIGVFQKIFQDAKLPLYLRPYKILVTSSQAGLIETIPNVCSLHQIRKNTPNFTTMADYFKRQWGGVDSPAYKQAQRNFAESLAAYSLVTHFLQVKDRHNGNIMLDNEGHIIHIDFGFMISNSPGAWNFETAPFKLTQGDVDVMGGNGSSLFQYFKALTIRGFMEARKYMEKIHLLIEMMSIGLKLSCLVGGQPAMEAFRERFKMNLTEEECIEHVEGLIYQSLTNWRTRHYDRYQYLTNSILY